jgi:hypothetical protein
MQHVLLSNSSRTAAGVPPGCGLLKLLFPLGQTIIRAAKIGAAQIARITI